MYNVNVRYHEPAFRTVATGLRFPEGPVALPGGDVLVVEIARGTLTRIAPDGTKTEVARLRGPNGAAIGPDGKVYVCDNGGLEFNDSDGLVRVVKQAQGNTGGSIERVDLETGRVERLYDSSDKAKLVGPNDLVFDRTGGFWFTDVGSTRARTQDRGGIYYARADGSSCREVVHPMSSANGIALSPDETVLYVAETYVGRLWAFDLAAPGEIRPLPAPSPNGGRLVAGLPGFRLLDSMAVDSAGHICVGTLRDDCGITRFSPDGATIEHFRFPDTSTTNICFGGPDLRTAYVTQSTTGKLVAAAWPVPGLALNFRDRCGAITPAAT